MTQTCSCSCRLRPPKLQQIERLPNSPPSPSPAFFKSQPLSYNKQNCTVACLITEGTPSWIDKVLARPLMELLDELFHFHGFAPLCIGKQATAHGRYSFIFQKLRVKSKLIPSKCFKVHDTVNNFLLLLFKVPWLWNIKTK